MPAAVDTCRTVLCLEDRPNAARPVVEQLEAYAGVDVVFCQPPATDGPCVRAAGGQCPLDQPVALVLDVRCGADSRLTQGELGVVCAEQVDLPIVVAGPTRPAPEDVPWASATTTLDDAPELCHALMSRPKPLRSLRIEHAVRRAAGRHVGDVTVTVHDWTSGMVVAVRTERRLSPATCKAIDSSLRVLLDRPFVVLFDEAP